MKTTIRTTEQELARVMMLLEDDGFENLSAHDAEIVRAQQNGSLKTFADRPSDESSEMNYAGGGYNRTRSGSYREAFYAGTA